MSDSVSDNVSDNGSDSGTARLGSLRILVAGASSPSGVATAAALGRAGAQVIVVGSNEQRLTEAMTDQPDVIRHVADLADPDAVNALADRIRAESGPIDGLIQLVGGWRGGGGLTGQTDGDWDFLHRNIVTTLRNTSRSFYPDLVNSPTGRLAIVSTTAVAAPTASGANYAAAKAAAETWMRSTAQGFTAAQSGHKTAPTAQHSAAVGFVIKALVSDQMRRENPDRAFPGYTDVRDLGRAAVRLFDTDAASINGTLIPLTS